MKIELFLPAKFTLKQRFPKPRFIIWNRERFNLKKKWEAYLVSMFYQNFSFRSSILESEGQQICKIINFERAKSKQPDSFSRAE